MTDIVDTDSNNHEEKSNKNLKYYLVNKNPDETLTFLKKEFKEKKKDYNIAVIGDQNAGKSTFINVILGAWQNDEYAFMEAPIGVREAAGTKYLRGPYLLKDNEGKVIFKFYDGMGFEASGSDPLIDAKNFSETLRIARGEIKPGFLRYESQSAFEIVPEMEFNGIDLFILIANGNEQKDVENIQKLSYNLAKEFIDNVVVFTRRNEVLQDVHLPFYFCIDSPPSFKPGDDSEQIKINDVHRKKITDILITSIWIIENASPKKKRQSITYSIRENLIQANIKTGGKLYQILQFLVIIFAIFIVLKIR